MVEFVGGAGACVFGGDGVELGGAGAVEDYGLYATKLGRRVLIFVTG